MQIVLSAVFVILVLLLLLILFLLHKQHTRSGRIEGKVDFLHEKVDTVSSQRDELLQSHNDFRAHVVERFGRVEEKLNGQDRINLLVSGSLDSLSRDIVTSRHLIRNELQTALTNVENKIVDLISQTKSLSTRLGSQIALGDDNRGTSS